MGRWAGEPVLVRSADWCWAPLVLAMIILRTRAGVWERPKKRRAGRRFLLFGWLALLSLPCGNMCACEAGREAFFSRFILVLAFDARAVPCERRATRCWARAWPWHCGVSLIALQMFCFTGWPRIAPGTSFDSFGRNLVSLLHPPSTQRQMAEAIETNRREAQLPRCRG